MTTPLAGGRKKGILTGFLILFILAASFVALVVIFPFAGVGTDLSISSLGREKIAVVEVFGVIISSSEIVELIKKYSNDNSIKGILVHIDSPGGAVAPSQEIYNALLEARKKKKIVASMGTLAASGGYYIAVGADKIIANPGTITGSIGVIMGFMDMRDLMEKVGMKSITVKSGEFKDVGTGARPFTPADRKMLQSVIDDVYMQFVEAVSHGRNIEIEKVKKFSDGRIYSGRQSLELGMIDKLGGYTDAVKLLSKLAGISGEPVIVKKKEEYSFLKELLSGKLEWLKNSASFNAFNSPGIYYLWTVN